MAASDGFSAFGTTFLYKNKPVLEMTKIDPPFGTVDDVDTTNNDSPDMTEESVPGIIRTGNVGIEGNLLPTDTNGQMEIKDDLQDRTSGACAVILPGGRGMMTFTASPKLFKATNPCDGKAGVSISLKASGITTRASIPATGLTTPFFALRDNGSNAITPSPVAAGDVYNFHTTLDYADTAIAIQPTAAAGTIYVNGTLVTSGAWSGNIAIATGDEKMILVEARETDKASKVYRIYVRRPSA